MAKKRVKRDEAARRGPIRNRTVQASTRLVQDVADRKAEAAPQTPVGAVKGAVESTVATAYTVIEKYMNRGHSAASLHSGSNGDSPTNGSPDTGTSPDGGFAGWPPGAGFGSAGDPWGVDVWMEPWRQMMRVWTDGMSNLGGAAGTTSPLPSMMRTEPNIGVMVQVQSARPTTVALDLMAGADAEQHLTLGPLCRPGDSAVTLEGVELVSKRGRYSVQLNVSDSQAPGVYTGPVQDAQNEPLGELTVVIADVPGSPKRASGKKRASSAAKKK